MIVRYLLSNSALPVQTLPIVFLTSSNLELVAASTEVTTLFTLATNLGFTRRMSNLAFNFDNNN